MVPLLAWSMLVLGGCVCVLNLYVSFLGYAVHRLRGLPRAAYRGGSGIPLIGSALVALSLLYLPSLPAALVVGITLIAVDTGGIHWFVGGMIYDLWRARGDT